MHLLGSVVIPAHNAAASLTAVLEPLAALGPQVEVVLVDDGSSDNTAQLARRVLPRVTVLRHELPQGPASARNHGAEQAAGEVVVFIDGDVVTTADTVVSMIDYLRDRSDVSAVFGCYRETLSGDEPPVSRFRNMLHRYVHRQAAGQAVTFWAGLGAVKRDALLAVGGFDQARFRHPSVEDVELGFRMASAGYRIHLEPKFQGLHLKRWTLRSMVLVDVFRRAAPWTCLILEGKAPSNTLNLSPRNRLAPIGLALALPMAAAGLAPWPLLVYLAANTPIYRAMAASGLGARPVLYLAVHHLSCLLGAALGVGQFLMRKYISPAARLAPRSTRSLNTTTHGRW